MTLRELGTHGRIMMQRHRWMQIGLLLGIWWLSDALVRFTGVPVPGAVVGLGVVLLLLASGRIPRAWFRRGANGLLDHLLLFFVPATMALLDHRELFGLTGLKILVAILVGTVLVMTGTALAVELCLRWRARYVR